MLAVQPQEHHGGLRWSPSVKASEARGRTVALRSSGGRDPSVRLL